jgi:RNA polymerase sigma factor (sigma-70 family)
MDTNPLQGIVRQLRHLAGAPEAGPSEDRRLLEQFLSRHDESAFALLVRRHGPLVLGVCRRILRDPLDADDAFQAVFLVLLRKARSLRDRDLLANWLYGVAYRTALKARTQRARRRALEKQVAELPERAPDVSAEGAELREALGEEVRRLPEKYRLPVLLCYLQGATLTEAARELGWPAGTVSGRLARAREMLRGRLTRRGMGPAAAAAEAVLWGQSSAAVPGPLVESTVQAAASLIADRNAAALPAPVAALMKGVLNAMFLSKVKIAVLVVLAVGVVAAGTWAVVHPSVAGQPPEQGRPEPPLAKPGLLPGAAPRTPDEDVPKPAAFDEARVKDLVQAAKVSDKLKSLLTDQHKAAHDWTTAQWQEFFAGRGTLDLLEEASQRLLEAERALSDKKADQVAAFDNHWRRMQVLEQLNQARFDAGRVAVADLSETKFYRIQAEIWLERAKGK